MGGILGLAAKKGSGVFNWEGHWERQPPVAYFNTCAT